MIGTSSRKIATNGVRIISPSLGKQAECHYPKKRLLLTPRRNDLEIVFEGFPLCRRVVA
jgi:hypothetical protein